MINDNNLIFQLGPIEKFIFRSCSEVVPLKVERVDYARNMQSVSGHGLIKFTLTAELGVVQVMDINNIAFGP